MEEWMLQVSLIELNVAYIEVLNFAMTGSSHSAACMVYGQTVI